MRDPSSSSYWNKMHDARNFDSESRFLMKMEEHLKQLDLRVQEFEEKDMMSYQKTNVEELRNMEYYH